MILPALLLCGCGQAGEKNAESNPESERQVPLVVVDEPAEEQETKTVPSPGKLIAIDPGHQAPEVDMSATEPDGPGSSTMKQKATTGTEGTYSGIPEYALNLDISKMLRDELQKRGYRVLLTREDNQTAISNSERAQLANNAGADLYLRIHANGSESNQAQGALALIPTASNPYIPELYESSKSFAETVLSSYCEATGFVSQGVQETDTMTGINWSKVPVMILEMGFMTNEHDDLAMADTDFRKKMVGGIANGLDAYFGQTSNPTATAPQTPVEETSPQNQNVQAPSEAQNVLSGPGTAANEASGLDSTLQTLVSEAEQTGGRWSICVEKLNTGECTTANSGPQQSASLIKLFIAAAAEQELDSMVEHEQYIGETTELIYSMLSASDNEAANTLTKRLGNGDASSGMAKVSSYCANNGYSDTSMGRLMLDFTASSDNYTSAKDCCALLRKAALGQIQGSDEIIYALKHQERRAKLPAGIPEGVQTANKTGELDDVENDAAIVYAPNGTYIICVMSENLTSPASARAKITDISSRTYQLMN